MKKSLYRLAASVVVSLLVVCLVDVSGFVTNGHRTDGLFYQASGLHPDAQLLTVNDQVITAEEFLYWLAYDCEYLSAYITDLDLNAELSEGMTYGDYACSDALETVKLYAVVRQWAQENGVSLTEADQAALAQQREQYVSYYGGEEGYQQQIQGMGVSETMFDRINQGYYLYAGVRTLYCTEGSALYPTQEELDAMAQEGGYVTSLLLYWSLGGENDDNSRLAAKDFARRLQEAEDVTATYLSLAEELGLEGVTEQGITASAEDLGQTLSGALAELEPGQVSDVIETDSALYVAVGARLDHSALVGILFEQEFQAACDGAVVTYNQRLYDRLDAADFYTRLQEARSALS